MQHRLGIQQLCLWEATFAIACGFLSANVSTRRRGASPSRSVWVPVSGFGFLGGRGEIKGTFLEGEVALAEDRTLPLK
jgi:hypothetical protein